ncbi:sensor histidine kinase [Flagellimonas flava]|uniref:Histidine kinase n=1 Tax=Flagellimonas flava TaxID=570519 RepID=A0A1M5KH00_9FLAO|nr:histidine kinase [Allomuricauda flava]SHG51900.1 Histidine kinase [Allomuricauda flava]
MEPQASVSLCQDDFVLKKKAIYKVLFRLLVINLVFFLVKATMERDDDGIEGLFNPTSIFYYVTAFFLFMLTWEANDWLLKKQRSKGGLDFKSSLVIIGKNMALLVPITALVYYLGLFVFRERWGIICDDTPEVEFVTDFFRATLLGLTVIFFNMFHFSMNQREELTKQMEDLKREMLASKYSSLKNQISPHFLFNSLNTLTSLMYEDRDLASDFVTRLASSYRYILDNREQDLVSLQKEMGFLDSFVFMMNVRHKNAVRIKTGIELQPAKYLIPTLSLQMLVENALKHNYYSIEKPLEISISTIGTDALSVRNNLRKRKLKEPTTQLGLKNIKKRYAYYTNKQVLVREEENLFEVIIPLLGKDVKDMNLIAIS